MQLENILLNKVSGLWLRINTFIVRLLCQLFTLFPSFLKHKKITHDVLLFPHAFKGNTGYSLRFEQFFPNFKENGISYSIVNDGTDEEEYAVSNAKNHFGYNVMKVRILWSRFNWVLKSGKYSCVYIQRGLLPLFFDIKIPFLEALLKSINPNIIVDFWDAIWLRQPELVHNTTKCAKIITVSNTYLKSYFDKIHTDVRIQYIVRDVSMYKTKSDYSCKRDMPVIVWTGQKGNLLPLIELEPVLSNIFKTHPFTIRIIGKSSFESKNFPVEHHYWNEETFYTLLNTSDIGIYVQHDTPYTRGKSAMKIIDYMCTGLPVIASPYGALHNAIEDIHVLYAIENQDWEIKLKRLIESQELREKLGKNAMHLIETQYSISKGFEVLRDIIYSFKNE